MKALHDRNDSCPIELSGDDVDVDVEGGDETLAVANGSFWIIRRLCGIASDGKGARRASVLKVFTAVVTETSEGFVRSYLKYILEIVIKTTISKAQLVYEDDKATYIVAFEVGCCVFIVLPHIHILIWLSFIVARSDREEGRVDVFHFGIPRDTAKSKCIQD
jgi:hypothetical protein